MLFRVRRRCWADGRGRAQEEEAGERAAEEEEVGFWNVPRVLRQDSDSADAGAHREVRLLRIPN